MKSFTIGDCTIGHDGKCFIIAEAGVNHNGSLDTALKLVDAAVAAGADAVKFQTFVASELLTKTAEKATYQKHTTGSEQTQYELIKELELTYDSFVTIQNYCRERGITFLSTPFDIPSAEFLNQIGIQAFKIPSGEITNHLLIKKIASFEKPIILSTGMSNLSEVESAVFALREMNHSAFCLLHCVSNYPAAAIDVNLRAIDTMSQAFKVLVGYSDHTLGIEISLAAVARGSKVIEKHFTLDRNMRGPDHSASLEPNELIQLVRQIRSVENSLGDGIKKPAASEQNTKDVARKSIVSAQAIPLGTVITENMLCLKRPGTGLAPNLLTSIVGRTSRVDIESDCLISLDMLS